MSTNSHAIPLAPSRYHSAWELLHFPGSGNFLTPVGSSAFKVCRYDQDTVYFWDRAQRRELAISKEDLMRLLSQEPTRTAVPRPRY